MRKLVWLVALALVATGFFNRVAAQEEVVQAKVKFIYNFTRYVEWPENAKSGDFVIYVYGSSELFNGLKTFTADKFIGNRPVKIQKIASASEIDNCHLLYVGFSKAKEIKDIKAKLSGKNTLIISERDGSLEDGAMINFIISEDKLTYEIKPNNATVAGLKLNSAIVNFAKRKI